MKRRWIDVPELKAPIKFATATSQATIPMMRATPIRPGRRGALQLEDKIGTMLPCNVVVQELAGGNVDIAAIDPAASMQAIDNPKLKEAAAQVGEKLRRVVDQLRA